MYAFLIHCFNNKFKLLLLYEHANIIIIYFQNNIMQVSWTIIIY